MGITEYGMRNTTQRRRASREIVREKGLLEENPAARNQLPGPFFDFELDVVIFPHVELCAFELTV
jgi:hypothetical protein